MLLSNRISLSIASTAAVVLASLPFAVSPANAHRISGGNRGGAERVVPTNQSMVVFVPANFTEYWLKWLLDNIIWTGY